MFEKMSMHDFRALIAERSTMNIYLRGETFELVHHSVGFLLEGFIKVEGGHEELLTAPAELLPRANQSSQHSETSGISPTHLLVCLSLFSSLPSMASVSLFV